MTEVMEMAVAGVVEATEAVVVIEEVAGMDDEAEEGGRDAIGMHLDQLCLIQLITDTTFLLNEWLQGTGKRQAMTDLSRHSSGIDTPAKQSEPTE